MLEQVERDDNAALFKIMARVASESYWFFLRVVLDYRWMDPWFHGEEVNAFLNYCYKEKKDCAILLPREHGKTGMITQPRAAWELARNRYGRCIIANANEDKAAKMARTSAHIIERNRTYRKLFPEVMPSKKWGENGYYLNVVDAEENIEDPFTYFERVDPSIGSYGIRGNVTGAHPDTLAIADDLISDAMADYPDQVRMAEKFIKEFVSCVTESCFLACIGTRWTYFDYFGKIVTGELQSKKGKLEVLKLGITIKRDGKEEITWPRQTYFDLRGKQVTVGFNEQNIDSLKRTRKEKFSALYYNEPVLSADVRFNVLKIKTFSSEATKGFTTGPVARVCIEQEGQQKAFIDAVERAGRERGTPLPLFVVTTRKQEKDRRIMSILQTPIDDGLVVMRRDLMDSADNIGEEMRTFPKGYKDCLDALSYGIKSCENDSDNLPCPLVHISCDPAFSEGPDADYSAIAVTCRYLGNYYVLDCFRFQSPTTDITINMLFNVYQKYVKLAANEARRSTRKRMRGFRAAGSTTRSSRRQRRNSVGIDNDLDIDYAFDEPTSEGS